ncbi:MAG: PTS glucose transporter subunit IIA [Succinivibrio sp.]
MSSRNNKLALYLVIYLGRLLRFFREGQSVQIVSPFEGDVIPSSIITDINISRDIFGFSIGVLPSADSVRAPCDCVVERISEYSNALSLICGKHRIIINVGLEYSKYPKECFSLNVQAGQKVKKGSLLLKFNNNALRNLDSNFMCVMTIRHPKNMQHISMLNVRHVSYDSVICNLSDRG